MVFERSKIGSFVRLLSVLCVFAWGCGPRHPTQPGIYVGSRSLYISNMVPSDVIMVVNGEKITRHDFDVMQAFYGKIFRLCNTLPLVGRNERADRYVHNREQKTPEELFSRTLMRQEADRRGISVTPEQVLVSAKGALRGMRRAKVPLEDVAQELGGEEGALFLKLAKDDARSQALRRKVAEGRLDVSEKEIDEGLARVADFNRRADVSNEVQRAHLAQAVREVRAGGDFAAIAKKYSLVHPEQGADWQTVELGELASDSPLREWLSSAKVGELSGPLDLDDGLSIVKLLAKSKGDAPDGVPPPDIYHLARITVLAFERSPEMSRDEVRAALVNYKNNEIQKELGTRLFNTAVLEYPNGTNWFPRVGSR